MSIFTRAVLSGIRLYRKTISPDSGLIRMIIPFRGVCVMYPSCSIYMEQAIIKYGLLKGLFKGGRRILRCHPYQKKLVDEP